jgi:uncharacterized protein (UPF0262 family)
MSKEFIEVITLSSSIKPRSQIVENERNVAIADLIDQNVFEPKCMTSGPYHVDLSIEDGKLAMGVFSPSAQKNAKVLLSVASLRGIIRDYFMICESYYAALGVSNPSKIEAIDMGRRGIHNEGSERLVEILKDRIHIDFATARRLFTLVCVLHLK